MPCQELSSSLESVARPSGALDAVARPAGALSADGRPIAGTECRTYDFAGALIVTFANDHMETFAAEPLVLLS